MAIGGSLSPSVHSRGSHGRGCSPSASNPGFDYIARPLHHLKTMAVASPLPFNVRPRLYQPSALSASTPPDRELTFVLPLPTHTPNPEFGRLIVCLPPLLPIPHPGLVGCCYSRRALSISETARRRCVVSSLNARQTRRKWTPPSCCWVSVADASAARLVVGSARSPRSISVRE